MKTHFSIIKMKESADFTHHIERITLNLHSSHCNHISSNSETLFFSHLGGRGKRIRVCMKTTNRYIRCTLNSGSFTVKVLLLNARIN